MEEGSYPGVDGLFVHPVMDDKVMAGNGTIGLELVEQLDGIDAVLIPWGGGGLDHRDRERARRRSRPTTKVFAVRARDRRAGDGHARERRRPRAGRLPRVVRRRVRVEGAAAVDVGAGRDLARRRVRALARRDRGCGAAARRTGAASSPRAPARSRLLPRVSGRAGPGRLVCIVSGGNIDSDRLAAILQGETPRSRARNSFRMTPE